MADAASRMKMNNALTVVYEGSQDYGSTAAHRMNALSRLGARVFPLDTRVHRGPNWVRRVLMKWNHRFGDRRLARQLIELVAHEQPDIVWLDKNVTLWSKDFSRVRKAHAGVRIVGYSPDDMMNPNNQTRPFLSSLPHYDMFFTTKSYGVEELKALGCPAVRFIGNAFEDQVHRPIVLADAEKSEIGGPVGFVGTAEIERAKTMAMLATQGIRVKVWGDRWDYFKRELNANFHVAGPSQYGESYIKIICAFDINLCFLRKVNRDLQTTRSIEIPACGAFMLAERTDEHLALFEEGVEAEFFADNDELLEKVRYYLAHPDERMAIAAAGRERCLRSGYSNVDRMRQMLREIEAEFPSGSDEAGPEICGSGV